MAVAAILSPRKLSAAATPIERVDAMITVSNLVFCTRTPADVGAIAGKIAAAALKTIIPPSTAEISSERKYRYAHMKAPDSDSVELTWSNPAAHLPRQ